MNKWNHTENTCKKLNGLRQKKKINEKDTDS